METRLSIPDLLKANRVYSIIVPAPVVLLHAWDVEVVLASMITQSG